MTDTHRITELHKLIHSVATHPHVQLYQWVRTALEVKIADTQIESLGRLEASSRRLETPTIHLKYLTVVLVILTAVLACHPSLLLRHP